MTIAQDLAAAALTELREALRKAHQKPREGGVPGYVFTGSHNCLNNIESDYARRNRGHWFDRDSMRFFGTRYASGFLDLPHARVTLFVTTEKPPHGPRAASIRAYLWDSADVDTVGPFCVHSIRDANKAIDIIADALAPIDA